MRRGALLCLPLCSLTLVAQAKNEEDELLSLLNTPISVASKKAMTTRESPGIVTLLRREEILASGARDLQELLRQVPGFEFAADVQGVISLGVRGNWAHEGKVLLLLDGQEMNETRYATLQFGNHFAVDQIQQVEVIRGPGSAIYGGFAELAVINIITRSGSELKGGSGALGYSQNAEGTTRRTVSAAYGDQWDRFKLSLSYFGGTGQRSTQDFYDVGLGATTPMKGHSDIDPGIFNLGLQWGELSFRYIQDRYRMTDFTSYLPTNPSEMRFDGRYAEVKYQWKLSDTFSLTPKLNWKDQSPWLYTASEDTSKRSVVRTTAELQASWDPSDAINLLFGGSSSKDQAKTTDSRPFADGSTSLGYSSHAFYLQALWKTDLANVTVGARYDSHEVFGSSFVPRLAVTKIFGNYHFKFLASKAFRAPVIENIQLNPQIKPEKTTAIEIELGAQLSSQLFASFNVFDIRIKDPISYVFIPPPGPGDYYQNFDRTGTRGVELETQVRGGLGFVHSTLSYSRAVDNQVPFFAVPSAERYMVGLPNLKFTTNASFRLGEQWAFNPSFVALGPRFAYLPGGTAPQRTEATTVFNLWFAWKPTKTWDLSAGVTNLMDSAYTYIQAYGTLGATSGNAAPIPSAGREVSVRLGYRL